MGTTNYIEKVKKEIEHTAEKSFLERIQSSLETTEPHEVQLPRLPNLKSKRTSAARSPNGANSPLSQNRVASHLRLL